MSYEAGTGCGRALITAFLLPILVGIGSCAALNSRQIDNLSLPGVRVEKVLRHDYALGGLLEGCVFLLQELEGSSADSISRQGIRYMQKVRQTNGKEQLSSWTYGSFPHRESYRNLYALSASGGCNWRDAASPGGAGSIWWSTYAHGEGMIVIDPDRRLMWSLYFG